MIIGIWGWAQAGKDTVADHLCSDWEFSKIFFSWKMKEVCKDIWDFSDEQLYGDLKEVPDERYPLSGLCPNCHMPCPVRPDGNGNVYWCIPCNRGYPKHLTPRLALQSLGSEYGRTLYRYIWINHTFRYIDERPDVLNWVISDVRIADEFNAIKNRGGIIIKLRRGGKRFNHESENEIASMPEEQFDLVLEDKASPKENFRRIDEEMPRLQSITECV